MQLSLIDIDRYMQRVACTENLQFIYRMHISQTLNRVAQQQSILLNNTTASSVGYTHNLTAMDSPVVTTSAASLQELESLMYAHVEQRLRHATERNNLPLPAMHYRYVTSSGQVVERPGSPMIQQPRSGATGTDSATQGQRAAAAPVVVVQRPTAEKHAHSGGGHTPNITYTGAGAQVVGHGLNQYAHGYPAASNTGQVRVPLVNYSPPHVLHPERPLRPKAPSPNSIHKDLLLPPDATDAEVERNLRISVEDNANYERTQSSGPRDYVTSPPSIVQSHHGTPYNYGMTPYPMSQQYNNQQNEIQVPNDYQVIPDQYRQVPYPYQQISDQYHQVNQQYAQVSDQCQQTDIVTSSCDEASRPTPTIDEISGKLKVTDLDQDGENEREPRTGRPESPVPDLIDDTR